MGLTHRIGAIAGLGLLLGCGGPVPPGMFLTMSVSTEDIAVETTVNGKTAEFLSGGANMTGSMPVNKWVREGENEATFVLTPVEGVREPAPRLWASLEASMKGETVDTLSPGPRMLFSRELTEDEAAAILDGETLTITERFVVDGAKLKAMKEAG